MLQTLTRGFLPYRPPAPPFPASGLFAVTMPLHLPSVFRREEATSAFLDLVMKSVCSCACTRRDNTTLTTIGHYGRRQREMVSSVAGKGCVRGGAGRRPREGHDGSAGVGCVHGTSFRLSLREERIYFFHQFGNRDRLDLVAVDNVLLHIFEQIHVGKSGQDDDLGILVAAAHPHG